MDGGPERGSHGGSVPSTVRDALPESECVMTASSKIQQQHVPVAASPAVLLTGISGRTPSVPENASSPEGIRLRPTEEQVSAAAGMAAEVSHDKAYREDFGKRAPDPAVVALALGRARALSDEVARAEAWLAYLKGENAAAWQQALEQTHKLQEHFEIADRADPDIAHRYPGTRAFYAARVRSAERAATTRKRNRAAKKPA